MEKVVPLSNSKILSYNSINSKNENNWNNLAVVKLNGGLGTRQL